MAFRVRGSSYILKLKFAPCACGFIPGSNHLNVIEGFLYSIRMEISSFALRVNSTSKPLMVPFTAEYKVVIAAKHLMMISCNSVVDKDCYFT